MNDEVFLKRLKVIAEVRQISVRTLYTGVLCYLIDGLDGVEYDVYIDRMLRSEEL